MVVTSENGKPSQLLAFLQVKANVLGMEDKRQKMEILNAHPAYKCREKQLHFQAIPTFWCCPPLHLLVSLAPTDAMHKGSSVWSHWVCSTSRFHRIDIHCARVPCKTLEQQTHRVSRKGVPKISKSIRAVLQIQSSEHVLMWCE